METMVIFRNLERIKQCGKPGDLWSTKVCYFFSLRFVSLIQDTNITPDMVTWMSIVVSIIASVLLLIFPKQYSYWVFAAILYQISYILDCADGQLARFKKQFSLNGWRLDLYSDKFKESLMYISITYVLSFQSPAYWFVGMGTMALLSLGRYVKLYEILNNTMFKEIERVSNVNINRVLKTRECLEKIISLRKKSHLQLDNIGKYYFCLLLFALLGHMEWFLFVVIIDTTVSFILNLWRQINTEVYVKFKFKEANEQDKEIVLFGIGVGGKKVLANMLEEGIHISYICDNNESKWGTLVYGVEIVNPERLKEGKDTVLVFITSIWWYDIKQQLLELGIREEQMIIMYDY